MSSHNIRNPRRKVTLTKETKSLPRKKKKLYTVSLIPLPVEESLPVPADTRCCVEARRTAYCVVRHTRCHGNDLSRPVRNNKLQHNCACSRSLYNARQNNAVPVDLCAHGISALPPLPICSYSCALQCSLLRNTTDYGFRLIK